MTGPVDDEQILHVVRLLELVQHRRLGVAPHARRAQLVNRPPLGEHLVVRAHDLDPRLLEHLAAGGDHVLAHLALVVAELIMEAQRGDPPGVFGVGIQVDVILVARQHLTEAPHPNERPGMVTHLFLELRAESGGPRSEEREDREASTPLEAVAAYESRLTILQVAEPRNVKPAGPTVVERGDRKSTRLNSSHEWISYAVFCLKKKKNKHQKRR